jgi:hypothetical protein
MKLAKFLLVLNAVEKGSAFVVKNHATGEVTETKAETECVQKIGGLCVQRKTKKHHKKAAKEEDLTSQYGATSTKEATGAHESNIDPIVGYAITKDKTYLNLALADSDIPQSPITKMLAAKNIDTNPEMAYALTKDPNVLLADTYAKDPTLTLVAQQNNNNGPVTTEDLIWNKFLNPSGSAAATYALTGSNLLAHGAHTGNKLPMYASLAGRPELATGHVAATLGEPLLAYGLTGDRDAMYAGLTSDPTLSYTAQQLNNPTFAYQMTGDPLLAMRPVDPNKSDHTPVNPIMAMLAAKNGDANLAYALTGDAATTYASTLPADTRNRAAIATSMGLTHNPLMTHYLTKDPVMTLESIAHANPGSPGLAYIAANTADPSMAMALTGNPAIGYAAQTTKPGLTGLAVDSKNPAMAYYASKDKLAMAMASDNPTLTNYAAVTSGDPTMAYALTGDVGSMYAAQHDKPVLASILQQSGNPTLTYLATKDLGLAMSAGASSGTPFAQPAKPDGTPAMVPISFGPVGEANFATKVLAVNSGNPMLAYVLTNDPTVLLASQHSNPTLAMAATSMKNPLATYAITKDPVLTMMTSQLPGEAPAVTQPSNSPISYVAANSGNPVMSSLLTNNPAVLVASQHANPTLALAATNMNNPAATYMLTKDPVLTMMASQAQPASSEPAKPVDPLMTHVVGQTNIDPAMAYGVTGDPNMLMKDQWANKDLALANALSGNQPASTNPTMDLIAAHTVTDPQLSYALTGNPLISHAIANGQGKDIAALMAGQTMGPMGTYLLTKDPKLAYLSTTNNPLLTQAALNHSPALAAVTTGDPLLLALP